MTASARGPSGGAPPRTWSSCGATDARSASVQAGARSVAVHSEGGSPCGPRRMAGPASFRQSARLHLRLAKRSAAAPNVPWVTALAAAQPCRVCPRFCQVVEPPDAGSWPVRGACRRARRWSLSLLLSLMSWGAAGAHHAVEAPRRCWQRERSRWASGSAIRARPGPRPVHSPVDLPDDYRMEFDSFRPPHTTFSQPPTAALLKVAYGSFMTITSCIY